MTSNVNIFEGKSEHFKEGKDVLVVKNMIYKVAKNISTIGTWGVDVKTGGLQQIKEPALNPDLDKIWVFGLRERFSL